MKFRKFPNNSAYSFSKQHNLEERANSIRNTPIQPWEKKYKLSVRRGYLIALLEKEGLLDKFIDQSWPEGKTDEGKKHADLCLRIKDDYENFLSRKEDELDQEDEENEESLRFALELHLRDFLVKNLDKIEKGLTLYKNGEITGIEFSIEGGRIDILAIDKKGKPVIIELKLSNGRNKVLGQILYYMSWIDINLGLGESRGIIIANDISSELRTAISRAPGVQLASYKMQFSIEHI